LGKETPPINASKKTKWDSKNDEEHILIKISISGDLWFHIQGLGKPNNA
jgi:hypothetical protein